ncbi:MAG TPA: NAD(P)/FAD-dependent oxidoreductase [Gammaproteobacteria bacterium]|jgi:monoamine oxidase|nr:NAD(P)/FAD-dependent oxidoreductase [Gammaproteobacteria bacterium]
MANLDRDVVIVGAGIAGLHAALTLEAAGLRVLVLEAQQRVGGRIHSMRQLGNTAEAGGTYIGAGYSRVIGAAERHGVELMDVTPVLEFFREQDLVYRGEIIRQADWPTHPANDFPAADKEHLPWNYHRVLTMRENPLASPGAWLDPEHAALDVSAHDWFRARGLSERAIELAYGLNVSFGRDARDVSALLLLFRGAFSKSQRAVAPKDSLGYTARHGVQRICEGMAAAVRGGVELGHAVAGISLTNDRATVRCANGRTFTARHVVAAVPLGVLGRIAIDPALPKTQAQAVANLPSQPLTQVYLAPKSRFWESDGHAPSLFTDTHAGMLQAARNRDRPSEVTSFTAWVTGNQAADLDRLPPAEAGRKVVAAIEAIRPASKGQLEVLGMHSWANDAYAGGAWAYFRPGDVTRYAAVVGHAHGRLQFCGEHLALQSRGMEGAMESAEEAVAAILAET